MNCEFLNTPIIFWTDGLIYFSTHVRFVFFSEKKSNLKYILGFNNGCEFELNKHECSPQVVLW